MLLYYVQIKLDRNDDVLFISPFLNYKDISFDDEIDCEKLINAIKNRLSLCIRIDEYYRKIKNEILLFPKYEKNVASSLVCSDIINILKNFKSNNVLNKSLLFECCELHKPLNRQNETINDSSEIFSNENIGKENLNVTLNKNRKPKSFISRINSNASQFEQLKNFTNFGSIDNTISEFNLLNTKLFQSTQNNDSKFHEFIELDHISCVILLLIYHADSQKKKWILQQELRLFALRFAIITNGYADTKLSFSISSKLGLKIDKISKLPAVFQYQNDSYIMTQISEENIEFITKKNVFIKAGYIYLPETYLNSIIFNHFSNQLEDLSNKIVSNANRFISSLAKDDMLLEIIVALKEFPINFVLEKSYKAGNIEESIRLSLNNLNKNFKSLPPCMSRILNSLKSSGHLKYNARLELWPFLKDCGMKLDEQLHLNRNLWKLKDEFDKEHNYTLRHIYGLEGKKQEKKCYNCNYLISSPNPKSRYTDLHGCPFKDLESLSIKKICKEYDLNNLQIEDVVTCTQNNEFELACRKFFEYVHPGGDSSEIGISPINFYINAQLK